MKKSVLLLSLSALALAVTGCANNQAAKTETAAAETPAAQSAAPVAATANTQTGEQGAQLDGALCLFNGGAAVQGLNELVASSVGQVVPTVQSFSDPKAIPEVCKNGYIMVYALLQKKDDKQAAKPAKGKKAEEKAPELSMAFRVLHKEKPVLDANGPLSNDQKQLAQQIHDYSVQMTQALLKGYREGTLDKAAAQPAAQPAPATKK